MEADGRSCGAGDVARRWGELRCDGGGSPKEMRIWSESCSLILSWKRKNSLISYSVNQRTKEIGICMALGASSGLVQREVLTKTLRLALAGVALGTLGSFAFSKGIESLLFGTTPTNPAVFSGVSLLCAVALVAAYVPARRASRIDPMRALRTE